MYKSFYSLTKVPFTKEMKSSEAYASSGFTELSARLEYLKKSRGIGPVTGEPGVGKTLTLRAFCASLSPSLYKVVYFPLATLTVQDFYRGLATELGEDPRFRKVDLFYQIQKSIQVLYKERKITPVLVLDELQMARDAFLCDLSILFNFAMDSENPFILILSGLPYLSSKLALNQHRPLFQRILMKYKLDALGRQEVSNYVKHHMQLAGAAYDVFSEPALEAIFSLSCGWPRLINQLATQCLLYGCQTRKEHIDEETVRIAVEDIGV